MDEPNNLEITIPSKRQIFWMDLKIGTLWVALSLIVAAPFLSWLLR